MLTPKTAAQLASKRWRDKNPEKVKKAWHDWFAANREYRRQYDSEYGKSHPEVVRRKNLTSRTKRQRWLDGIALYYGCSNPECKWDGEFEPAMLEFHHIDETQKKACIAHLKKQKLTRLVEEINKCCVLCSNCHRAVTWGGLDCSQFRQCNLTPDGRVIGII